MFVIGRDYLKWQFCCWVLQEARGVLKTNGEAYPYLREGMAGRPTRTLIEFIAQTVTNAT